MSVPVLASSPSGYSQLNIQGVLSSNITATPALSTYPTNNTSTSLGHYHFVDPTTKASNHLNVSASGTGGHIFSHVDASQAPTTVLKVDRTAMTLDTILKNTSNKTNLDMTNNQFVLQDTTRQNLTSLLNGYNLVVSDSTLAKNSYVRGENIATSDDINRRYTTMTSTELKLENLTNNDVAILSINDLTFNGVSLPSTVSTLLGDITTLSGDITTLSGEIATINNKLPKMVVSQVQPVSTAIYADSSIAPQTSPYLNSYGYGGWAYAKASPQASNAKINWYFPFPIIGGTVGDLKGLYYQIFNNCTNAGDLPFFTVYTRPTGSGDFAPWYHSSRTYTPTTNSPANETAQAYANIKSLSFTPQSIGMQNQLIMTEAITNGTYLDTDVILFIACGTNSGSPLGSVNFSCGKIGMITNDYSAEFLLL
jgi:hypothetical protein